MCRSRPFTRRGWRSTFTPLGPRGCQSPFRSRLILSAKFSTKVTTPIFPMSLVNYLLVHKVSSRHTQRITVRSFPFFMTILLYFALSLLVSFAGNMPSFHSMGFWFQLMHPLLTGYPIALFEVKHPEAPVLPSPAVVIDAIRRTKATTVYLVPSFLEVFCLFFPPSVIVLSLIIYSDMVARARVYQHFEEFESCRMRRLLPALILYGLTARRSSLEDPWPKRQATSS
jgi:hypothetical protein